MATKQTKSRTWLWVTLGVLLLGALAAWTFFQNRDKKSGTAVEFGEVTTRRIEERVSASGRIFPVTEVIISSDISGEVVALPVAEGDSVRVGQLLARVDADAFESQVSSGRASVNAARAQAANAEAQIDQFAAAKKQLEAQLLTQELTLKRTRQLAAEGLTSAQELEQAEATVAATRANIEAAEANVSAARSAAKASNFQVEGALAQLNELRTQLRRTSITAPMTGVVSKLDVEEGERVVGTIQMTGTEMMRIADLSRMEVQVEVSENDVPRLALGDPVDIEVDAYLDRTFRGEVTEISNSASNLSSVGGATQLTSDQVTNFIVTISIDPASYADLVTAARPYPLRPGMSASVEVLTEVVEDAVAVPIAAVTAREVDEDDDRPRAELSADDLEEVVWLVPSGADTVARRRVRTGVQDREAIQITEGLAAGDRVVVGPYGAVSRKLESGDKVYEEEEDARGDDDDDDDDADA